VSTEALIQKTNQDRLVGHISRDSTAIEAREKADQERPPSTPPESPKRKRGRPKKGQQQHQPPKPPTRLQRQGMMSKQELLKDLPTRQHSR
jgi:hypothetical protein